MEAEANGKIPARLRETTMSEFTNNKLMSVDIPAADADWEVIEEFALSFDGYEACGSFEKCAEIANVRRHGSLTDLRTCLFFEQRRWRHFGVNPDGKAMKYIRSVIEKIRLKVTAEGSDKCTQ